MKHFVIILFIIMCAGKASAVENIQPYIQSDSTWRVARLPYQNWYKIDYDDSAWEYAVSPSRGLCSNDTTTPPLVAQPMWIKNPVNKGTAYFRKTFTAYGEFNQALLKTSFDDDGDIYINNTLIRRDTDGTANTTPFMDDIIQHLHQGKNTLALKGVDSYGGCQHVQVSLTLHLPDYILDVPLFKQNDDVWADDEYDNGLSQELFCGDSMADCGCATTSLAMLLSYHGVTKSPYGLSTSPEILNNYFKKDEECGEKGCVSKGYAYGNVRWSAASLFSKDAAAVYGTQKIVFKGGEHYSKEVVQNEISNKRPVILKTPKGASPHWFVANGFHEDVINIRDPYYGIKTLSEAPYNNSASTIRKFEKTASDFSVIEIIAPEDQRVIIKDMHGNRTGITYGGKIYNEIPDSAYFYEQNIAKPLSEGSEESGYTHNIYVLTPEEGTYSVDAYSQGESASIAVYATSKDGRDVYRLLESESKSLHAKINVKMEELSEIQKTEIRVMCPK